MATFLDDALMTGDLLAACGKAGISLLEYRRERARDPYFDEGCLQVDQVVKLAIISNLEAQAASGSIQAATLLAKGLGELRASIQPEDPRTAIKGHVSPSGLISVIAPPGLHPLVLQALDETLFRCT
jgi:hypothetical protein